MFLPFHYPQFVQSLNSLWPAACILLVLCVLLVAGFKNLWWMMDWECLMFFQMNTTWGSSVIARLITVNSALALTAGNLLDVCYTLDRIMWKSENWMPLFDWHHSLNVVSIASILFSSNTIFLSPLKGPAEDVLFHLPLSTVHPSLSTSSLRWDPCYRLYWLGTCCACRASLRLRWGQDHFCFVQLLSWWSVDIDLEHEF